MEETDVRITQAMEVRYLEFANFRLRSWGQGCHATYTVEEINVPITKAMMVHAFRNLC